MKQNTEVRVWDPLVRVFHWTLVGAFTLAYFTEDDAMAVHVAAGYTVAALLLFRLIWGFIGPQHARFGDFVRSPQLAWHYLRDTVRGRARRYLGHNPAGGWMILLLLAALAATAVTGLIYYGAHEHAGPFARLIMSRAQAHTWKEVHEFFANAAVVLVFGHVSGVILSSLAHRENLPLAMITGRKRREDVVHGASTGK